MSLYVYDRRQLSSGELKYDVIMNTSEYFDSNIKLPNTEEVRSILWDIDRAKYIDEYNVQGTLEPIGIFKICDLSSGCKAALCCALQEDKIVYPICAGPNAIFRMLELNHGKMIYISSSYPYNKYKKCDILYRNKHFLDMSNFLKWRSYYGYN